MAKKYMHLAPHKSAFDPGTPRTINRNLAIPNPVIATQVNWLHSEDALVVDPVKEKRMIELLGAV